MRFKLIACDVFLREICFYAARTPHIVDLEFTELGSHSQSDNLREIIQAKIDKAAQSEISYDAVLLGYGLCGNALVGIAARNVRLVVPRAHDCCTILLGSGKAFRRHFADNPSQPFSSAGYMERCASHMREDDVVSCDGKLFCFTEYASIYGEDNARYIFEQLRGRGRAHSRRIVFIETPFLRTLGHRKAVEEKARAEGKELVVLKGSGRLLRNLVWGCWAKRDFCIVEPRHRIEGVYDWNEVLRGVEMHEGH